jgi:fibronectin type 3 domain-containing protein
VTGTTYTDTGRANGTPYSYTVVALNGTVASAASTPVSCTPVSAPPAAPTGLIANAGNASVSVSWTASPGATAYQVHRNGVDIGARTSLTTFLDTTALNNTTYTYTVSAYKQNSGASALSASASATPVAPALSAPTGLAATPGDTTVSLSWNAVSGATSYLVYRNGSLATTTATTSFNDSSLTNSQTYTYYVVASNGTSTSAASATASAKPMAAVAGAPTGLTGQAGDHLVTLTWTGVSGVTQYKVYRGGVLLTTVTGTTYADATAVNNTAYTYYVTAMGTTESAPSTSVTVTPVAITPAVPTGLVPTSGNAQVSLSWTAAANAQSYRVYRGGTLVGSPSTTNFIDTGLTNGTSYTYTVVSVNGSAVSAASAGVSSTPMAPAPGAPTNLVGTPGNNSATLTWTAVANATSYKVYRGGVLLASPTTTTYLDSTALNGTPYSYWVTAVTATTEGVASATVNVTPAKPPVNGTFTGSIVSIASGHGTIRVVIVVTNNIITTSTGTLLTNDGSETVKINTNALPTYNSKAVTANGTGFTKVSGASLTFAAYKTSMQAAMTAAGI